MRLAFITNNAARPPRTVADHLTELGVHATPRGRGQLRPGGRQRLLAERLDRGARVAMLCAEGLREALGEAGLTPVGVDDDARPPW